MNKQKMILSLLDDLEKLSDLLEKNHELYLNMEKKLNSKINFYKIVLFFISFFISFPVLVILTS